MARLEALAVLAPVMLARLWETRAALPRLAVQRLGMAWPWAARRLARQLARQLARRLAQWSARMAVLQWLAARQ